MKYFASVYRDGIQNLGSECQMRNLDPILPCRVLIHTLTHNRRNKFVASMCHDLIKNNLRT